jgi:succinoglycan biosynthesis protein ExoA
MRKPIQHCGDKPEILVVIPCLNEELHLERVVRDVVDNFFLSSFLLVIVDGGSTDQTPLIAQRLAAQFPQVVRYLKNPKRIQSVAVNMAVAHYGEKSRLLLRLDSHADYPKDYCRILVTEEKDTEADAVVVSMNTAGKACFQRAVAAAQNSILGNGGAAHRRATTDGKWVDHGHHALIRLDAFRAVGGYDEEFSHNEDAELDVRLQQAGYKIWLTGKTILTYYPRANPHLLLRQYFHFGLGRARTALKHRLIPQLRQMVLLAVAPSLFLALAVPISWAAALPMALWTATCLAYGLVLAIRAKKVDVILAGPAAMLMHLGWSWGFMSGVFAALWRAA